MKTTMPKISPFFAAGLLLLAANLPVEAQTYTWADNAQGNEFQHCPDLNPQYWPNNSLWTQSLVYGPNCDNSSNVVYQPSNWTPTPAPGIHPGGPGLQGVDIVLGSPANTDLENATVMINHLTLQADGGLYLGYFGLLTATTIEVQSDAIIGAGSYAGELNVASGGSLTKSGGAGTLGFGSDGYGNAVSLNALNAGLVVKSGTFVMPYKNAGGWFGGTFAVSNNATVLLNPDSAANPSLCDLITGVGGGTVLMTGTVRTSGYDFAGNPHTGLTLQFPGDMFQWTAGALLAGGPVTNLGVVNLSGNGPGLAATMFNSGLLKLADNSSFALGGSSFYNQSGGIFNILGNSSVTGGSLNNYGLLLKSAGTGTSSISARLNNYGGIIEADHGTLALNVGGSGGFFSDTSLVVSNEAVITFLTSNFSEQVEGMFTGSGNGSVMMTDGTLLSYSNATINFPGSMFQWAGGTLQGPFRNAGTINLVGSATIANSLTNDGLMLQGGLGSLLGSATLNNDEHGVYDVQNDSGIAALTFNNSGRLQKTAGTGTNLIAGTFNNSGTIVAASGALLFNENFNQNAGDLQLSTAILFGPNRAFNLNGGKVTGVGTLGGSAINNTVFVNGGELVPGNPYGAMSVPGGNGITLSAAGTFKEVLGGPGQFGQLVVSNLAYLGGTLKVTLANSYTPPIGTQIPILLGSAMIGTFSNLDVPPGIAVTYSNTGVYLTVTSAVPPQVTHPILVNTNFMFTFGTVSNQSYSVYSCTNLASPTWNFYTNLTGDGTLRQITVPAQIPPQQFFRVGEP